MCEDESVYDPIRIIIKNEDMVYLDVGLKTAHTLSQYLNSPVEVLIEDHQVTIEVKDG